MSAHLYKTLGINMKDQLQGDQFKVKIKSGKNTVLGFWPAVGKHLHCLMLDSDKQLSESTKSAVVSFEWLAHVHEVFNNIFMNTKEIVVGANNVDILEQQLQVCLAYFDSLRVKQIQRRDQGIAHWEATFLDYGRTWSNLGKTCRGFIAYCHLVAKYASKNQGLISAFSGVNVARSSLSILEA